MVTAKDVASIRLTLPHSNGKVTLDLFRRTTNSGNPASATSCVIYGRNGSGKSSVARALAAEESDVEFLGYSGSVLPDSADRSNVFVFNEDYIDRNFRQFESSQLDPVILLGDAAKNFSKEEGLVQAREKKSGKLKDLKSQKLKKETEKDKARTNIKKTLDNSWKIRSGKYNPRGQDSRIGPKVIPRILGIYTNIFKSGNCEEVQLDINKCVEEFNECVKKINAAQAAEHISWTPPVISVPQSKLDEIKDLFANISSSASSVSVGGDDIKSRISKLEIGVTGLRGRLEEIFSGEVSFCSTCLQDISKEHVEIARNAIISRISEVENDSLLSELRSAEIPLVKTIDIPRNIIGGESVVEGFRTAEKNLNVSIDALNEIIRQKADNPSASVVFDDADLKECYEQVISELDSVSKVINAHNIACRDIDDLRKRAESLNDKIAAFEISSEAAIYQACEPCVDSLQKEIDILEGGLAELNQEIADLRNQRKSEALAAVEINKLLRIVYGYDGINVEPRDEGYAVVNRGNNVTPCRLSTGERNILSLCYFLVSLADGKEFETCFSEDQLIVLDDPISSFDNDNKYGVIALLNFLARKVFSKNSKAKVLILTHDLNVAYLSSKGFALANNHGHAECEISEGVLTHVSHGRIDYYLEGLQKMLDLALASEDDSDFKDKYNNFRPNEMRRVWEAFAVFELGDSKISDATLSRKVTDLFEAMGERQKEFLNAYLGKQFVNVDSHSDAQIRSGNFALESSLTSLGYRRFIREMICIMHLISPNHLPFRLHARNKPAEKWKQILDGMVAEVLS
ncbi:AAA family ATPase [Dermabacteraceae bacterium P13138]